jgi:ribosomal-protein-alanine N-acetyltransferase
MKHILDTERLRLREYNLGDASHIIELLNDPGFIENIRDVGVRTIEDANAYLKRAALASYEKNGFGLSMVELKSTGEPVGMCGLVKRDTLEDVDIGFAFLKRHCRQGYGYESSLAMRNYARDVIKLKRLVAITNPDNIGSIRVVEKIGLQFEKLMKLGEGGPEVKLFGINF